MNVLAKWRGKPTQFERAADGSMTLMEHLNELRSRLFRASLGILVGCIIGWFLSNWVLGLIEQPYCDMMFGHALAKNHDLVRSAWQCPFVQLGATDVFVLKMKLSLWSGLIVTGPIWLYQIWAFVAPGLHRHERRWAYVFAAIATPLFALGAVLAYFVVAKGLQFLLQFNGDNVVTQLEITRYVDFVTGLMLLFGIAFEFPLGVMLANIAGVVTAKRLMRWWRGAVFAFFVFAAIATPTADPFGMSFLALALSALYFGAVGFAYFNDRRRGRDRPAYLDIGDDETSSLDGFEPEPVDAAAPIDGYEPVSGPEPVDKPRPLDRRYDDVT
jgi:sec-independent protein translocase protein TatC